MPAPKGNKFAIGNSGTSKQWESQEELKADIDRYFNECDSRTVEVYVKSTQEIQEINKPIPYTIEGLCEALDCTRESLLNYEKKVGYEEYFSTIKRAKLKIQRNKVERGLDGDSNPAVTIFDLKNNHNYKDKTEVDQKMMITEQPLFSEDEEGQ
jgi:hypothetical protein